jgi:uncharacterized DUF497 family protein
VRRPGVDLAALDGIDWDDSNTAKIRRQHRVEAFECEEVLLGAPRVLVDEGHSRDEDRWIALGATATGRRLSVVFAIRGRRIRVVTARDQSRRERKEMVND